MLYDVLIKRLQASYRNWDKPCLSFSGIWNVKICNKYTCECNQWRFFHKNTNKQVSPLVLLKKHNFIILYSVKKETENIVNLNFNKSTKSPSYWDHTKHTTHIWSSDLTGPRQEVCAGEGERWRGDLLLYCLQVHNSRVHFH